MGSRSELYSPLKLAPALMRNEVLIPSVPVDTDRIGMREAVGGPVVCVLFCACLGFVVYFPLLFPPNLAWPKLYVRVLLLPSHWATNIFVKMSSWTGPTGLPLHFMAHVRRG